MAPESYSGVITFKSDIYSLGIIIMEILTGGPRLSTESPNRELGPCEGLQQGLGGSLRASQYLGKNTGVVDGSLYISTLLFSFRIYIDYFTMFAVEIATH
jgi:serine/threonine protein kinase